MKDECDWVESRSATGGQSMRCNTCKRHGGMVDQSTDTSDRDCQNRLRMARMETQRGHDREERVGRNRMTGGHRGNTA